MSGKSYLTREDRIRIKNQVMGIIEKQNSDDLSLMDRVEHTNKTIGSMYNLCFKYVASVGNQNQKQLYVSDEVAQTESDENGNTPLHFIPIDDWINRGVPNLADNSHPEKAAEDKKDEDTPETIHTSDIQYDTAKLYIDEGTYKMNASSSIGPLNTAEVDNAKRIVVCTLVEGFALKEAMDLIKSTVGVTFAESKDWMVATYADCYADFAKSIECEDIYEADAETSTLRNNLYEATQKYGKLCDKYFGKLLESEVKDYTIKFFIFQNIKDLHHFVMENDKGVLSGTVLLKLRLVNGYIDNPNIPSTYDILIYRAVYANKNIEKAAFNFWVWANIITGYDIDKKLETKKNQDKKKFKEHIESTTATADVTPACWPMGSPFYNQDDPYDTRTPESQYNVRNTYQNIC